MDEIIVTSELKQNDEDMLTEEIFILTFCGHASKDDEMDVSYTLYFKIENATEEKINSKINLEIQPKKIKMNLEKCSLLLYELM